jgi:hypothetical protein
MREDPQGAVFQREVGACVIITGRLLQGDRGFQGLVVTAAAVQLVFAGFSDHQSVTSNALIGLMD